MSLFRSKYLFILLNLLISFSFIYTSDQTNYAYSIIEMCNHKIESNESLYLFEQNFQRDVKINFELFICDLFEGIYKSNNTFKSFNEIFKNVHEMDKCFNEVNKSFSDIHSNFYYHYLSYSGSRLNKIGDEKNCVKRDLSYYLIEMYSNYSDIENSLNDLFNNKENYEINDRTQHIELTGFLENNEFYLGLCLWKNCIPFFDVFFNRTQNEPLFNYLSRNGYSANNWTFVNNRSKDNIQISKISLVLGSFFILIVVFVRILIRISYYCTEKNQSKEPKLIKLNPLAPSPEEIQLTEQHFENDNETADDEINNNKDMNINRKGTDKIDNINQLSISDTDTRFSKLSSIMTRKKTQAEIFLEKYKFVSIDNLYLLETKSYNSKNLEEINGLRFFVLFFISFYHLYNTFYLVKWNNPGTLPFYQNIDHILLVKLSKMSFRIWIFFDGFEWCFKLISYINKLKTKTVTFKHFMIFNINIIEKILVFIVIFLIFIYQFNNIGNFFLTTSFALHSKKFTSVKCYKNPLYILILPFIGYKEKIGKYEYCFSFAYILVNELYCIIICTFLFFLFFKLRSKLLEYTFLFLFFISIFFSFLYFTNIKGQFYYKRYVIGEDLSLKFLGIFFQYFFIGCISGLIYYYSTVMNLDLEKYNIFENCYKFMYCYINMNHVVRHFLGFLSLFLIGVICCYYPFLFEFKIIEIYRLVKKIDFFTYLVISYESFIQLLLFLFFFFDIKLSSEIFTKIFLSNDIFIIFERCSFIFMIIAEQVAFLFETLIYLDGVYWNTENIVFLSIICFLITLVISICFSFFIQFPIRLFTKTKEREKLDDYEKEYKYKFL